MNIRPKTVRRLLLILLAVGLFCAGGAAIYQHHQHRKQRQLLAEAEDGKQAFKEGDYPTALRKLGPYVKTEKHDIDALFAHATARSRVEIAGGDHIRQAIPLFNEVLALKPDHLGAAHELLELYTYTGYRKEAIDLANRVLAEHPQDTKALRAKTTALVGASRFEEALQVSQQLNQAAPKDLHGQFITFELFTRLKHPPQQVLERMQALVQQHPDDPRFELLMFFALDYAGQSDEALVWLRRSAERKPPNAEFVRLAARAFDALKLYDESQALLERAARDSNDPEVARVLVQRLWQNARHEDVVAQLEHLKPADPQANADLLAFRAMSLHQLGQHEKAMGIVAALKDRRNDNSARAWSTALEARFAPDQSDQRELISQYQAALSRDRNNGVIRAWVGDTYYRLGETELAIQQWRMAADSMPSWAAPHVMIARAMLATNRPREAFDAARNAWGRAPGQLGVAVTLALAWHRYAEEAPADVEHSRLGEFVAEIQKRAPGESETLPIHVTLLARSGQREAAVAAIRSALQPEAKHSVETLMKLAEVSLRQNLDLEQEILQRAQVAEPRTPSNAYMQALALASAGQPQEGLAYLEKSAAAASGEEAVQWRLAVAQYREAIGDRGARDAWFELGNAHPNNVLVQTAILREGRSVRNDRDFTATTIARVRKLTGEEGNLWQLEHARWLLASPDTAKDSATARHILMNIIRSSPALLEPRLLLVDAFLQIKDVDSAIGHLKAAVEVEPREVLPMLQLARLLHSRGKIDEARPYLQRLARNPSLTADQRRMVAAMMAQGGDIEPAIALLLGPGSDDPSTALLLAELHRRRGAHADAERLYQQLLSRADATAESIAAAADFYASAGRLEQAEAALTNLDRADIAPEQRALLLGQFSERYGQIDEATAHYVSAAAAAPTQPATWEQLVRFHLRNQHYRLAAEAAERGLQNHPENTVLAALQREASARSRALIDRDYQPLIDVLSGDPAAAAEVAMLKILRDNASGALQPAQLLSRLESAAREHQQYLPLQTMLVQEQLARGNHEEAARAAERAMVESSGSPEAAKLAASVYKTLGRWLDMRRAAEIWRQRASDHPIAADVAMAEAMISLNDASAALKQLEPHLSIAQSEPRRHGPVLETATRAMVAAGRHERAQTMLEPLLDQPAWRVHWLRLAMSEIADVQISRKWIELAEARVPGDAAPERLMLARAWANHAARNNIHDGLERAREILMPLRAADDRNGDVAFTLASVHQMLGETDAAAQQYRQVVAHHPQRSDAKNDLAYLLVISGGDLEEARRLVSEAIQQSPRNASYYDTLARVEWKVGNRDRALAAFDEALKNEPHYVDALVGKATVLTASGDRVRAAQVLTQIDAVLPTAPPISPAVREELELLRASQTRSMD